jgi:adenylylsulfate kinase-like enzyme
VWFTGRSGSGKSTIARELVGMLEGRGMTVTVLDVVPLLAKHPCERTSEGKLLRKGYVAREVVRHGGVVVCVTVSARRATREAVRELVGPDAFIEVFVDPPAEVARERKDARGRRPALRKRVRRSLRRAARTVRPPRAYEAPEAPDLRIDTSLTSADAGARAVLRLIDERRRPATGSGAASTSEGRSAHRDGAYARRA